LDYTGQGSVFFIILKNIKLFETKNEAVIDIPIEKNSKGEITKKQFIEMKELIEKK
jgi:hypothetical protein